MSETKQLETLSALAEASKERERVQKRAPVASVRVSPGPYLALASVLTFSSALLLRSENDALALTLLLVAWLVITLGALTDRIVFDGQSLIWRGFVPLGVRLVSRSPKQIAIAAF